MTSAKKILLVDDEEDILDLLEYTLSSEGYDVITCVDTSNIRDILDEENISLSFLLSLINELPPKYQLVFNLYVLDGYSHQEISEVLNISIGTSKSNLFRARKLLQNKINNSKINSYENRHRQVIS